MTQAFNLSQLANKVDTNGDLDAATGLYNQVPVANGGTGAATLASGAVLLGAGTSAVTTVAAGTAGNVLTSNGTDWTSAANPASTGVNAITVGVASGTWTKPATVKSIKVTVVGGGGAGAGGNATPNPNSGPTNPKVNLIGGGGGGAGGAAIRYYPAASLPGPQPYTVGAAAGSSSFGVAPITVVSATGGANGSGISGGTGGVGTNGQLNLTGGRGAGGSTFTDVTPNQMNVTGGSGGSTLVGFGGTSFQTTGFAGSSYGGGGGGGATGPAPTRAGGAGAGGVVIIEEFY